MKYKPEFFKKSEFRCPCCNRVTVSAALIMALEIFRRAWAAPVLVNSGYRCVEHNVEVGGAQGSRHLIGCAADIRPVDLALIGPFQNLAGALFGRLEGWELKMYPRFVHVGVPREEAGRQWNEGKIEVISRAAYGG